MRGRWWAALLLAAGVSSYVTLAVTSMRVKSATFDEPAHLPAGYTYLTLRDHRLNPEHPPLVKVLAAVPLLFMDVQLRPDDEAWRLRRQWEFGRRFLYRWNDADRLLFWGRVPIVALGALLGAAVFFRARRGWGLPAAGLALFLCALSPDVLAHGQIVTTDVAAALFLFLSVVAFERLIERAGWRRLVLAGLAAGAAVATKFSMLIVAPLLLVLGLVAVISPEPMRRAWTRGAGQDVLGRSRRVAHVAVLLLGIAVVALFVLWASYGFASALSPDPVVEAAFDWARVGGRGGLGDGAMAAARRVHLLPDAYAFGFLRFFRHSEARPTFLLGKLSDRGFWYYFPVTFALKTPLALVALLVLSVATRRQHPASPRTELFLWVPVVFYFVLACALGLNIGHRHLLPIYPFLFVIAGRCAAHAALRVPAILSSAAVAVLAAWYAVSVARVHPHYLAYFNELAGGPAGGHRYLVDSNLDWGQDLKGLKAWTDTNHVPHVKLSYFGTADPEYHRIPCVLLPGQMLPPPRDVVREIAPGDIVAVSATNLQGVYLPPEDRPLMERLRALTPVATVGHSILIYRADFGVADSLKKSGALAAASAVLVLLAVEAGLRLTGYTPRGFRAAARIVDPRWRLLLDCYPSNPRGYFDVDLRAPESRARYQHLAPLRFESLLRQTPFAVESRYNSLRFRDAEFAPKRPGARRVMVLGDSFTEGQGVKEPDTYARVLEARLRFGGGDWEVRNCGRRGADFPLLFEIFEQILRFEPDVVVYGMVLNDADQSEEFRSRQTYVNDLILDRGVAAADGRPLPDMGRFDSRLVGFVRDRLEARRTTRETTRWYLDMYETPNREGWARTQDYLKEMNRRLRERGARFLVASWPLMVNMEGEDPFEAATSTVSRFCLAAGIPWHDLRPALRAHPTSSLCVHPVDMHPNELAHRLAAESLAPVVRDLEPASP